MSVVSYCSKPVCTAPPEETLRAAAQRMEKEGIGFLVVTEKERLAGVLTDRDVALYVAADGKDASHARIADAMNRSPVVLESDAALREAFGLMRSRRVRRVPVVDREGRVAGVLSLDGLVRLLAKEVGDLGDVLAAQLPAGASRSITREALPEPPRRAVEHYGRDVVTAPASASIADVAREMQDRGVGSVVVLDEDEAAIGLLSDRDLAVRVAAAGLDPATTTASAVMSSPLIAADPSDPLEEVVAHMRTASVRRIPILRDGRPVGIVTFDDLLVAFGNELQQLGACVAEEIWTARLYSYPARLRQELEDRIEEAATQLLNLGEQTLRSLGGELEQVVDRVAQSIRWVAPRVGERAEVRARDLMRTDVRTCTPEDALSEPARIMWERDCGCVPVVASDGSGRLVGMITDRDVCMATYTSGERLAEMQVKASMATRLHSCRVEDPVSKVAHVMRTAQVRRLPVVDAGGHLRGILSLADVARAAAERAAATGALSPVEIARTLEAICRPRSEVARLSA